MGCLLASQAQLIRPSTYRSDAYTPRKDPPVLRQRIGDVRVEDPVLHPAGAIFGGDASRSATGKRMTYSRDAAPGRADAPTSLIACGSLMMMAATVMAGALVMSALAMMAVTMDR